MQVLGEKEQWRSIEGEMPSHQKFIDSRPKKEIISLKDIDTGEITAEYLLQKQHKH